MDEHTSYELEIDQIRASAQPTIAALKEDIRRGHKTATFLILLVNALIKDGSEFFLGLLGIGPVLDALFIGEIMAWTFSGISYYIMKTNGWLDVEKNLKKKIQIAFWGLSFFVDSIPVVDILPWTTITVFYIRRQLRKRAEEAQIELAALQESLAQEIERIQIEEVEEENNMEDAPEAEEYSSIKQQSAPAEENSSPEKESESPRKPQTTEDIYIPEKIRDPLEHLKKEYFETPPDQKFKDNDKNTS